jgi:alpha-1,2-mannosyltransferase
VSGSTLGTRAWVGVAVLVGGLYVAIGLLWSAMAPSSVGSDALIIRGAAARFLDGEPVYIDPTGLRFVQGGPELFYGPPALVVAAVPLALVPSDLVRHLAFPISWLGIGLGLAILIASVRLRAREAAALAVGTMLSYGVFGATTLGAPSVGVFVLLVVGWWGLEGRAGWLCGLAIGTASAMRIYPAAMLLPLVVARRFDVVAVAVATIAAWWFAALVIVGPDVTQTFAGLLATMSASDGGSSNTSLAAIAHQFGAPDSLAIAVHVLAVIAGLSLLIVGGRLTGAGIDRAARLTGWGLASAGMLLVCPVVWDHYLTALLVLVVGILAITRQPLVGLLPIGFLPASIAGGLAMAWLPAVGVVALRRRTRPAEAEPIVSPTGSTSLTVS